MTETDKKPIGRPSLYGERMVTRQISLAADAWETLKDRYGGDSYSATIRAALLQLVELEGHNVAPTPQDAPYRIEFDTKVRPNGFLTRPATEFKPGGTIVDATDVQSIQLTLPTDRGEVMDTAIHFAVLENVRQIRFFVERLRHRRVYPNGID